MNLEVTLTSTRYWGTGGNGTITIKNLGSALSNWSFQLVTQDFTINEFWTLVKEGAGNSVTIKPASWKPTLAAGEVVESGFGFTGKNKLNASSSTAGVTVKTPSEPVEPLNLHVTITSTQNWGSGGNGNIVIKNLGGNLSDWKFQLTTSGFVINEFWTLTKSGSGHDIVVGPPSWNPTLPAGEEISSGFSYTGDADLSASTTTPGVTINQNPPPPTHTTAPPPTHTTMPPPTHTTAPPPTHTTAPPPTSPPSTQKKAFGYYSEWSIYQRKYTVDMIPADKLTHVLYAFMLPNPSQADYQLLAANYPFPPKPYHPEIPEATLVYHDEYAGQLNIQALKQLKARHPHLKVLVSIGGWTLSWTLSKVAADDTLRQRLVSSAVDFIINHGLDGLDVDWEYPAKQGIGFNHVSDADPDNLVRLLKDLRAEFNAKSTGKYYEITGAMGTNPEVITHYKDAVEHFDTILMMTYDYAGSWGNGGHLAGLKHNPADVDNSSEFNVTSALENTFNIGFPPEKICLGLPVYARGWAKINPYDPANPIFGQSVGGPGVSYSGSAGEPGLTSWKHLQPVINKNGLNRYYDPIAQAAYVHSSSTGETWSYDDPSTIIKKVEFAKANNLAGIMFWELSDDLLNHADSLVTVATDQLKL